MNIEPERPVAWYRMSDDHLTDPTMAWGDQPPGEPGDVLWLPLYTREVVERLQRWLASERVNVESLLDEKSNLASRLRTEDDQWTLDEICGADWTTCPRSYCQQFKKCALL